MTTNKSKKVRKQRGSGQCGYGKTHRGAGNRGGRGNAGTGKKADQKKPRIWKKVYFGKTGFTRLKIKKVDNPISLKDLQNKLDFLVKKGFAKDDKGVMIVNLKKAGYTKLLSSGILKLKLKLIVPSASKKAVEKVKNAGGEIINEV